MRHGLDTNSSKVGTVPSKTKMHGGTDGSPSMHLDSQHALGFPAAAVAAIGQAGGLGGSWGLLNGASVLVSISVITGCGKHRARGA